MENLLKRITELNQMAQEQMLINDVSDKGTSKWDMAYAISEITEAILKLNQLKENKI